MIDVIAGSARELLPEAAVHEQRDDEQYDGHGDLSTHEHGASPAAPPARRDAVAGFHHGGQIRTRRLNRRHEAEDHRAGHGDDEADRERAAIHLNRERDGKIRRQFDLPEQRHAGVADAEPRDTARQGEQQAFGHQLPYEAAAAGADGEAQRHLACARGRPARQETRDVGTCDEQHRERERRQHRNQRRVRRIFRHSRLQFGAHREPAILVDVRIRALQIRGDRCQFRLRRCLRDSGPQPSLDLEIPGVARLERTGLGIAHETRRHHQRHDEIGSNVLVHAGEFGRGDADHRQLVAVDAHAAAEHRRVGPEFLLPQRSPEHDDGVSPGYLILLAPEAASERRLDAHHGKEVAAGQHAHLQFRCACWISSEAGSEVRERGKSLEAFAAVANVHVIGIGGDERAGAESLDRRRRADREDFARARDGKRPQQQRVGKAEDRAVGADADRQREYRASCHSRSSQTNPHKVCVGSFTGMLRCIRR